MIDLTNWLRKNTGATETYYGYANPGSPTSIEKWLIRRETTESGDTVYEYADNDFQFDKIWDDKELYFLAPSAVTLLNSSVTQNEIIFAFDLVPGVTKYFLTILNPSQDKIMPWNRQRVRRLPNPNTTSITVKIDKHLITGTQYEIIIEAWNRVGSEISTFFITTL